MDIQTAVMRVKHGERERGEREAMGCTKSVSLSMSGLVHSNNWLLRTKEMNADLWICSFSSFIIPFLLRFFFDCSFYYTSHLTALLICVDSATEFHSPWFLLIPNLFACKIYIKSLLLLSLLLIFILPCSIIIWKCMTSEGDENEEG